jgi:hypothetical protein
VIGTQRYRLICQTSKHVLDVAIGAGDSLSLILLTLIPIAWLSVVTVFVALCRAASYGEPESATGEVTLQAQSDALRRDADRRRAPGEASSERVERIVGAVESVMEQRDRPRVGAFG